MDSIQGMCYMLSYIFFVCYFLNSIKKHDVYYHNDSNYYAIQFCKYQVNMQIVLKSNAKDGESALGFFLVFPSRVKRGVGNKKGKKKK